VPEVKPEPIIKEEEIEPLPIIVEKPIIKKEIKPV
jgi:hypothetical protein